MARTWFERKNAEATEWSGFLEEGVKFEGKLEASGTLRIDSAMKGTLASEGVLILGKHATVEGEISGERVLIEGSLQGKIRARSRVEIRAGAVVRGDIQSPCVIIEPGALFDGHCHMPNSTKPSNVITIPIRSATAKPK